MKGPRQSTGLGWDAARIRRGREYGWFRSHEAELIEKARLGRLEADRRRRTEQSEALRALHWRKCPDCGNELHADTIDGVGVEKCAVCEGFFFRRGELETLLLRHDEHRRGFFRRLLGFHPDPAPESAEKDVHAMDRPVVDKRH